MADVQKQLQGLSDEYQQIQGDLQTNVTARQRLEAQQQENLGVRKEFQGLNESANIYKMVGPVLLKQDRTEARQAVEGRLDFIENEIKRTESRIKEIQEQGEAKKMQIYQIQSQAQAAQEQQQGQPQAAS